MLLFVPIPKKEVLVVKQDLGDSLEEYHEPETSPFRYEIANGHGSERTVVYENEAQALSTVMQNWNYAKASLSKLNCTNFPFELNLLSWH